MNATDVAVITSSVASLTAVITGVAHLIGHASRQAASIDEIRTDVTQLREHVQRIENRQWEGMTPSQRSSSS